VTVASLSGKRVRNENAGYAVSKFGVMALHHSIRRLGIRATALCPGFVATDMTAKVDTFPGESMSRPEDLAELVATVLSLPNSAPWPSRSSITGTKRCCERRTPADGSASGRRDFQPPSAVGIITN
jgi:NAD(P)-dependent dehydrogenase (short-subunit alcohol dehydrogenase family)